MKRGKIRSLSPPSHLGHAMTDPQCDDNFDDNFGKSGEREQAWLDYKSEAARWARNAVAGDAESAKRLFEKPVQLKLWLDELAGRKEGEGQLPREEHPLTPDARHGYASGWRDADRFIQRGLACNEEALIEQYAMLGTKSGRADFKSDVQGIERAILGGSIEALREMVERSPMALWAMDFSLSEYEGENVLAFAAKYAPAGPDVEMIAFLRSLGAKLPECRPVLVVGEQMRKAKGVWLKTPSQVADALEAAGHVFAFADALMLMQRASFERVPVAGLPSVARQKVEWLGEMAKRGVDARASLGVEELERAVSQIPMDAGRPGRMDEYIAYARQVGSIGLGSWLGLGASPLRDHASWAELGPWLADHGLATQALEAAAASKADITWKMMLPYAEAQQMREMVSEDASGGGEEESKRAKRI